MKKLTAEAFAKMDPEMQKTILEDVPASELNNIRYLDIEEDTTIDKALDTVLEMYSAIDSPDVRFLLFIKTLESLVDVMANYYRETKDKEPPPKPVAMIMIMATTMSTVQEMINEIRKDKDEEDD